MLCRICKKKEATVKIYGYPLCDECRILLKAGMVSTLIGLVEKALDEATEKVAGGGDEGNNDSQGTQREG